MWDILLPLVANPWAAPKHVDHSDRAGSKPGDWHAYGQENYDASGRRIGAQAELGGAFNLLGFPLSLFDAHARVGNWNDGGKDTRGFDFGGNAPKTEVKPHSGNKVMSALGLDDWGFEAGGPNAEAKLLNSDDMLNHSIQANLLSGAVTNQTRGTSADETKRFGLSAGVGLAGRVHHSDDDGDGIKEYGFGFDFGPLSVDYKAEKGLVHDAVGWLDGHLPGKSPTGPARPSKWPSLPSIPGLSPDLPTPKLPEVPSFPEIPVPRMPTLPTVPSINAISECFGGLFSD
jgi:hypothetical protein